MHNAENMEHTHSGGPCSVFEWNFSPCKRSYLEGTRLVNPCQPHMVSSPQMDSQTTGYVGRTSNQLVMENVLPKNMVKLLRVSLFQQTASSRDRSVRARNKWQD